MKRFTAILLAVLSCTMLWGCSPEQPSASSSQPDGSISQEASTSADVSHQPDVSIQPSKRDAIPFEDGQLYAVAHLGYQEMGKLERYTKYLDNTDLPAHYASNGDMYLIIPRYDDMELSLFHNDIETDQATLFYVEPNCGPFILQCNVSDIFCDVTVQLTRGEEKVEFSPFISLKDGSLEVGERGLNLSPDLAMEG